MAHGGVGNASNICRLTIGPYEMNFTGYQPEHARGVEFCDDIPKPGKSIVVLDFIDKSLRQYEFEVRIMDDVKNLGIDADYENLGSIEEIERNTILHIKPRVYPTGTIVIKNDYSKKDWYIGMLTGYNPKNGQTYTSVFPFSVGFFNFKDLLSYIYWLIPISLGLGFFAWRIVKEEN